MSGAHLSKEFYDLIKHIGEAKSKQEEDQIILNEVTRLQNHMASTGITARKMKEYLLRMLYCEMLGHDASFGHIHAVNMTQQTTLVEKRVGYLTVMCTLHKDHELMILLINTIQKDLQSTNVLEVCAALTCLCKLINAETIPAVYNQVVDCMSHGSELVRKKAVMALHRFYQQDAKAVRGVGDHLNRMICDPDPCVMAASLNLMQLAIKSEPRGYFAMVPSLVSILKQIIEHRLHNSYDYHRTPAPWCQIQLLQCMAMLGREKVCAEEMYEVLNEVLRRADTAINIGYAVTYEAIRTICRIYPNSLLIEAAANKIGELLQSDVHNLRYLGLNALSIIISINAKYATEHQLVVLDCLEDSDETLKRKTLALLFKMTNHVNCSAVVDKMLFHLKQSTDEFLRADLVTKVTELAERFAPSSEWYISTMNTVFREAGALCRPEASQNLIRLLAEGTGEGDEVDAELRRFAVRIYAQLIQEPQDDTLMQVMAWVLGEYTYLEEEVDMDDVASYICELLETASFEKLETRNWLMNALIKIVAQMGECPTQVRDTATHYSASRDCDLAFRSQQLLLLSSDMDAMQAVLPVDASSEDLELDPALPFLDDFVNQQLAAGAPPYLDEDERLDLGIEEDISGGAAGSGIGGAAGSGANAGGGASLKFDAYDVPEDPFKVGVGGNAGTAVHMGTQSGLGSMGGGVGGANEQTVHQQHSLDQTAIHGSGGQLAPPEAAGLRLGSNVKKKWGSAGYSGNAADPSAMASGPLSYGVGAGAGDSALFASTSPAGGGSSPYDAAGMAYGGGGSSSSPYAGGGGGFPGVGAGGVAAPGGASATSGMSTQRQQMASSLFGGLDGAGAAAAPRRSAGGARGGGGAARSSASRPSRVTPGGVTKQKQQQEPPPPTVDDLLDLGGDEVDGDGSLAAAPASAPPTSSTGTGGAAQAATQAMDLLSLMDDGPAGASNSGASSMGGLDALFDNSGESTTARPITPEPAGVGGSGGSGRNVSGAVGSASEASAAALVGLVDAPASQSLVSSTELLSHGPGGTAASEAWDDDMAAASEIASDGNVRIAASKALSDTGDGVVITVHLANAGQAPLRTVLATLDASNVPGLDSSLVLQRATGSVDKARASVPFLGVGATALVRMTLKPAAGGPSFLPLSPIRCQFQYTLGNKMVPVHHSLPLTVADLIRANKITEAEFGGLWGSHTCEKRVGVTHSGALESPDRLSERVQAEFNVAHVKTIRHEVILSGKDVAGRVCLVHAAAAPNSVNITFRTTDAKFTEALHRHALQTLRK